MKPYFPISILALALCACSGAKQDGNTAFETKAAVYADSTTLDNQTSLVSIEVQYPTANDEASRAINTWIAQRIGAPESMMGQPMDKLVKSLGEAYLDTVKTATATLKEQGMNPAPAFYFIYSADTTYTTPTLVSYQANAYAEVGGAHGISQFSSAVFDRRDGKELGYGLFKKDKLDEVKQLVIQGLEKQYFQVDSEEALAARLLVAPDKLGLPSNPPFLIQKGVVFRYEPYEIAPYSEGMPGCILTYDQLRPYLAVDL